jgi:hypothetical protein
MGCYQVKKDYVERLCKEIKCGVKASTQLFTDRSNSLDEDIVKSLLKHAKDHGITISDEHRQALHLSREPSATTAFAWMYNFFEMVGDKMPNIGEIHLEPIFIRVIWEEYVDDLKGGLIPTVGLKQFGKMWEDLFPHVKIRQFKAVTGKCYTCAMLSDARRLYKVAKISRCLIDS